MNEIQKFSQFNSEWRTTLLFILCLVFSDRAIDSEGSWESGSSHSALPMRQQSEQEWDQQRTWMLPSKYARLLLHLRNRPVRLGYWGRGGHFISSYSLEINESFRYWMEIILCIAGLHLSSTCWNVYRNLNRSSLCTDGDSLW